MREYITYEQSPYNNLYYITLKHDEFMPYLPNGLEQGGSFDVLIARISGLSYPDYLRMCRDIGGATLIGKDSMYPTAYFTYSEGLVSTVNWLNARAKYILYRAAHPYEFIVEDKKIEKVMDDPDVQNEV